MENSLSLSNNEIDYSQCMIDRLVQYCYSRSATHNMYPYCYENMQLELLLYYVGQYIKLDQQNKNSGEMA